MIGEPMTTTTDIPKSRIDWTQPVLWLFALVLAGLILLPHSQSKRRANAASAPATTL